MTRVPFPSHPLRTPPTSSSLSNPQADPPPHRRVYLCFSAILKMHFAALLTDPTPSLSSLLFLLAAIDNLCHDNHLPLFEFFLSTSKDVRTSLPSLPLFSRSCGHFVPFHQLLGLLYLHVAPFSFRCGTVSPPHAPPLKDEESFLSPVPRAESPFTVP